MQLNLCERLPQYQDFMWYPTTSVD